MTAIKTINAIDDDFKAIFFLFTFDQLAFKKENPFLNLSLAKISAGVKPLEFLSRIYY